MPELNEAAIAIETPNGTVSGLLMVPEAARAGLVLAHGAGAGIRHHFMSDIAAEYGRVGVATLRYQFPYMEARQNRPDSPKVATETVRAAVEEARRRLPALPLFAGGKSFGGRMTSTAASERPLEGVRGIVFVGFPLHPPKQPATKRGDHLDHVTVPMLFLQGTRDELADLTLIREVCARLGSRATLHEIAEANHSFEVPKRTGKTAADVIAELARVTGDWLAGL
jgi:hypothetical protein